MAAEDHQARTVQCRLPPPCERHPLSAHLPGDGVLIRPHGWGVREGTTPVETFYTLSAEGEFGVANPEIVPIKVLSPQSDKGWIIVRHHATEAAAHAYIDCVGDCRPIPYDYSGPMVWQTGEGIFTLMHRPPLLGRPDHLIAYVTKVPAEDLPGITEDAFQIAHSDGNVTTDPELMFPTDSEIIGQEPRRSTTLGVDQWLARRLTKSSQTPLTLSALLGPVRAPKSVSGC